MNNEVVSLRQLQKLCEEFQVEFKLEVRDDGYIVYRFGPIGWSIPAQSTFTFEHYIEVVKRLSANYPEKVLKNE